MTLRRLAVSLLVVGLALMVPFDHTHITLALGIACLFGFVVCGLFCVASPAFLEADDSDVS